METDNSNNHSTADDFEHVEQTAGSGNVDAEALKLTDNGAAEQQQQKEQREHCHHNFLANSNNSQLLLDNDSICSGSSCCSIVEMLADMRSEFQAEIGAVKTENKLLQAQNGEQKAQIGELRANNRELQTKMELFELKAMLANEQTGKLVETKMNEMAYQLEEKQGKFECQQKVAGLEAKLDDKDMKMEQQLEKMARQLDDISAEFREKTSGLDDKIANMQQKFSELLESVQKEIGDVDDNVQKQIRNMMQANEVKLAERDKAVKAELEKMAKQLVDQGLTALGGKVASLESKRADVQNNWEKMQKRMDELMSIKMQNQHTFNFSTPNSLDKQNGDMTVNGLHVVKSGATLTYGNVMAKFAYATFYFELLVKQLNGNICIGVSGTDFTAKNNKFVGGIFGSWSLCSQGNCYNPSNCKYLHFPGGFRTNDTVGCGVLPVPGTGERVFFVTKNGAIFGTPIPLPSNAPKKLFPSVTLIGQGTSVEANFGNKRNSKPFKYNIAEHKF